MKSLKAKDITLGGILIALTIVTLYLTLVIPINTFTLLTIASAFIPLAIIRSNIKTGVFVYIASSIIGLLFIPLNTMLPFILYFGIYGIVKYFIEKKKSLPLEIFLKLLFSNVMFIIGYFLFTSFIGDISIKLPFILIIILLQGAFIIYDYALTLLISFYIRKFHKM